jgi:hypothetical protein
MVCNEPLYERNTMSHDESLESIFETLQRNPETCYITSDRKKLYLLIPDPDEMICIDGDFSYMSDERINRFVRDWLLKK